MQQILRREQQHRARVLLRFIDPAEIEPFVSAAPFGVGIEANFKIVGDEHPAYTGDGRRVFPSLVDRRFLSPRHWRIEVGSLAAFQFERRNYFRFIAKETKCKIDITRAHLLFRGDCLAPFAAKRCITQYLLNDARFEVAVKRHFALGLDCARTNASSPLAKYLGMGFRYLRITFKRTRKCPLVE